MSFASVRHSFPPPRPPRVSVVVPVYNAALFLESTLQSVFEQTYGDFEVIAVDDGSTDRSATILADLAAQEPRLQVLSQSRQGVAAARNHGIAAARGVWIAPVDADDIWHPNFLAAHVQLHEQQPHISVSYCWSFDINHDDQWSNGFQAATISGWVHNTMLCHYFLGNGSCSLIRRTALLAIDGYRQAFGDRLDHPPNMGQAVCEDWDLYLRLAEQYQFGVVTQFLVGYRKHPLSASQKIERMDYWHQQLLRDRQRRLTQIRPWVFQLSTRSFRSYLRQQAQPAQQTQLTQRTRESEWQTSQAQPPTPAACLAASPWARQRRHAQQRQGQIRMKLWISALLDYVIRHFGHFNIRHPAPPDPSHTPLHRPRRITTSPQLRSQPPTKPITRHSKSL